MGKVISQRLVLLLFCVIVVAGCDSGSNEKCESVVGISCSAGGEVQACCTTSNCRYIHNSVSFPCNGLNCDFAATTVVDACLAVGYVTSGDSAELDSRIETLLFRQKAENMQLKKEIESLGL